MELDPRPPALEARRLAPDLRPEGAELAALVVAQDVARLAGAGLDLLDVAHEHFRIHARRVTPAGVVAMRGALNPPKS
jgi:hypothetical protein